MQVTGNVSMSMSLQESQKHCYAQKSLSRSKVSLPLMLCCQGCTLCAVLRPDAAVYALAVPHLQMKALACPAAVLMFVAVGAFRGFKDTT